MFTKQFVVSEICISLNGDFRHLYPELEQFATTVLEAQGNMDVMSAQLPALLRAIADHQIIFHGVSNWGEVVGNEEDAERTLSLTFQDEAGRYAQSQQTGTEDIPSDWCVITLSFCYESSTPSAAIETKIRSIESVLSAFQQLSAISEQGSLRAFNLHWSPAGLGDNLTEDQVIELYPDLAAI